MISDKHRITKKLPEEIFLLNAVEQIVVSSDQPMPLKLEDTASKGKSLMKQSRTSMQVGEIVTVVFRDHTQTPIKFLFENKLICQEFQDSVKNIIKTMWPQNAKQFVVQQSHPFRMPTEKLLQQHLTYRDLDPENHILIRKMSQTMRQNHTSIEIAKDFDFHETEETEAEWVMINQKQQIRYNTRIFKSGKKLLANHEIMAEVADPVLFRIVDRGQKVVADGSFFKKKKPTNKLVQTFTKDMVRNLDLSLVDNRIVKLQIKDLLQKKYIDYEIIFSNIHKKHQFVQLLQMDRPKAL